MNNIYYVRGSRGGDAYLVVGDQKTALVDCGMAYCASSLIRNIKDILLNRPLDFVLLSHSHYDHVGSVPSLRKQWPEIKICGAEYDQSILTRPNALTQIRELSLQAAQIFSDGLFEDYDDELMKIDTIIADGDHINLGDSFIQVLETPGHTRSSLSFLLNYEILFVSESCGVLNLAGKMTPSYLVNYSQTKDSIKKCEALNPKFIYNPHYGPIEFKSRPSYWRECLMAAEESRKFLLHYSELGYNQEELLLEYEKAYYDKVASSEQPIEAFRINTRGMIKAILTPITQNFKRNKEIV